GGWVRWVEAGAGPRPPPHRGGGAQRPQPPAPRGGGGAAEGAPPADSRAHGPALDRARDIPGQSIRFIGEGPSIRVVAKQPLPDNPWRHRAEPADVTGAHLALSWLPVQK